MFIPYKQNGLTLLEMSIGLTVIALAIGATVAMYNGDTQKAESVITQLQMAKAGVLRYNMDNPSSTNKLADLVQPNEVAPHNWNGPYVDSSIRMTGEHFDISNVFPETHLELTTEVIGGTRYQALIVKGNADTQLRNAILAQCGDDCKPLPGREDLGLLIQQVAAVAPNTSGMPFTPSVVPATPPPPVGPEPPWIGPPTVTPPTIPYTPPPGPVSLPSVPTPPAAAPVPAPNPCAVVACTQPPVPSTPIPSPTPTPPPPPPPPPPTPTPTPTPVPSAQSKEITVYCNETTTWVCGTITATYIPISATQGYVINSKNPWSFIPSNDGFRGVDYRDESHNHVNYGYEYRDDGQWHAIGFKIVNGTKHTIITLKSWNAYTRIRAWNRSKGS